MRVKDKIKTIQYKNSPGPAANPKENYLQMFHNSEDMRDKKASV